MCRFEVTLRLGLLVLVFLVVLQRFAVCVYQGGGLGYRCVDLRWNWEVKS
uniref:Uncharacterized protein n=1 Tax=Arundo donax TaxID=35708 RepID=A0A0A9EW51_ARUDO